VADAIQQIVCDDSLRVRLREKGLARAPQFSWARTVARVKTFLFHF